MIVHKGIFDIKKDAKSLKIGHFGASACQNAG